MDKSIHSAQYKVFLKVLRDARRRAGLTQIDLAKRIGETQSFVSKCERGEPRIDAIELRVFCAAFGITLKQFARMLERRLPRGPPQQPPRAHRGGRGRWWQERDRPA
jgi:ribosome-binding protein aMBF1 (putative translation factor)